MPKMLTRQHALSFFPIRTVLPFVVLLLIIAGVVTRTGHAQSLTTGGISGVVTAASRAIVPNAGVPVTSVETGAVQNTSTNGSGEFQFSLLKPGHYRVAVEAAGFERSERAVEVSVGS